MRLSRRRFISGASVFALAGTALSQNAFAGDVDGRPLAEDDRIRIRETAKAALRRIRLTMALGKPLKLPLAIKATGIGDLDPRDAAQLRALVQSGVLKTATAPGALCYIMIEQAQRGLDYDPGTGVFRSVGRKLVQLVDARYGGSAGACSCLVTSVPDWPDGSEPLWAQRNIASRAFPEFDISGTQEHTLFFTQRGDDWVMSAAPVLSDNPYRGVAP